MAQPAKLFRERGRDVRDPSYLCERSELRGGDKDLQRLRILHSDGRRSGKLQLKLAANGKEIEGWYYSDKDGAKYEVSGTIGSPGTPERRGLVCSTLPRRTKTEMRL